MAEGDESAVSHVVNSVVDEFNKLPAAQDAIAEPLVDSVSTERLFSRERSVHELLGGSRAADVILWRRKKLSAAVLAIATAVYVVFEWLGCHVLSVLSIGLLIVFGVLFLWSNAATFVKRSPPNVPKPQLSEKQAIHVAAVLKDETNRLISRLHEVVLGKDIKLFLKVELGLWILAVIGKWADFLTLVYLGVVLALTVPVLYERHEDKVHHSLQKGFEQTKKLHVKLRDQFDQVMRKIPRGTLKEKKTE